jgi:hypothetical protein
MKGGQSEIWLHRLDAGQAHRCVVHVLEKYMKLQEFPLNEEQLIAFKTKMSNFTEKTKNWSKKSQKSAIH